MLEATRTLLGLTGIRRVDFCAARTSDDRQHLAGSPPLADLLIAAPGRRSRFQAIAAAERLRRPLRATAKSLYHAC